MLQISSEIPGCKLLDFVSTALLCFLLLESILPWNSWPSCRGLMESSMEWSSRGWVGKAGELQMLGRVWRAPTPREAGWRTKYAIIFVWWQHDTVHHPPSVLGGVQWVNSQCHSPRPGGSGCSFPTTKALQPGEAEALGPHTCCLPGPGARPPQAAWRFKCHHFLVPGSVTAVSPPLRSFSVLFSNAQCACVVDISGALWGRYFSDCLFVLAEASAGFSRA